jgi:hypothetical protein
MPNRDSSVPEPSPPQQSDDETAMSTRRGFLLMGLAMTNHMTSGLLLPASGLFVLAVAPRRLLDPKLLLKGVARQDARRFGVAVVHDDRIVEIEEKPTELRSNYVVTGFYLYDSRVFDVIRGLEPSSRGEFEITDVNNTYIRWGDMEFSILSGWWTDAGTVQSKLKASILVALEKGVTFHA